MQGIAGIIYPDVYHVDHLIKSMLTIIQPDATFASGVFDKVELGVLGSSLAFDDNQKVIVGIDGFITNTKKLKEELQERGYLVDAYGTPDIIAQGYHEWDTKLFEKLEGEYVLFILDQNSNRLLLVRDRIGIKRLYWYHDDTHFIFSSHIKSLLASKLVQAIPDPQAVAAYLYLGSDPLELSIIQGVNKLPAGHYLQYDLGGFQKVIQYWSYFQCFEDQSKSEESDFVHSIDTTLNQAVHERVPVDEPVGFVGRGNLGSALIGKYLSKHVSNKNLHSFSVGYEGKLNSFIDKADKIAKELDISHHVEYVKKNKFLDDYIAVVWNLDEPICSPLSPLHLKLGEMAAPITRSLFSQLGSEETLSTQSRYAGMNETVIGKTTLPELSQMLMQYAIAPVLKAIHPQWALSFLRKVQTPAWNIIGIEKYSRINSSELKQAAPELSEIFDIKTHLQNLEHLNLLPSSLASVLYYNMKTTIPDFYAIQMERLLSFQGIRWHTPFLDTQLICMTAAKFKYNISNQKTPYMYIQELVGNTYASEKLDYHHPNYITDLRDWLGAPYLRKYFQLLLQGTLVETGIISDVWLKERIEEFPKSQRSFRQLWLVLTLEIWFRLFINKEYTEFPKGLTLYELLQEL